MGGLSSDSFYCMAIGAGISELAGGSGVGVTGIEYVAIFLLVDGAHELVPVALMPVVEKKLFGTGRDDASVSNIVARFFSASR